MATRKKVDVAPLADKSRSKTKIGADAGAAAGQSESQAQLKNLEDGLQFFRQGRFADARDYFERAAAGPEISVAHTARNHINVCERRMQKPSLDLRTAQDHYNYGIERLNARDLEAARKHLEVALALDPNCDYMLYAFAAALALSGDPLNAYENLKRAIELEPRNRNTARQDSDFAGVLHNSLFAQLLHPQKAQPF